MKKNILYAFSIALLFAIPCTIKSMEIPTINYSDPKQKDQLLKDFREVVTKKQWNDAELLIKFVRGSKTNPEFANQLEGILKLSRENKPYGHLIKQIESQQQMPVQIKPGIINTRSIITPDITTSIPIAKLPSKLHKEQLLSDFEIALQSQEWAHAKDIINIVDTTVDKELAKQLAKEYNDFYNVIQASKPEAFPKTQVIQAVESALIKGFNEALSSGNFSQAQIYLDKIKNASSAKTFAELSQKLESSKAKLKIPVKPSPISPWQTPAVQSPYTKPVPSVVKPGTLVGVELVGCENKAPFKYIVTVIKENSNVYQQYITNTDEAVQRYLANVSLTDAKNYWIRVSDESQQTYPTIQEYSVKDGTIFAISTNKTTGVISQLPLSAVNLKQDKIKLIINCTNGKPAVMIEKAK